MSGETSLIDTRQGPHRRYHAIELPAAMIRNDDSIGPESHSVDRVFGVENTLDDHRARPEVSDPFQVFPGDARIEIGRQPPDIILKTRRLAAIDGCIAEIVRPAHDADIEDPGRVGGRLTLIRQIQHSEPPGKRTSKGPKRRDQTKHMFSVGRPMTHFAADQ